MWKAVGRLVFPVRFLPQRYVPITSSDQIQLVSNFRYFTSGVEVVSAICARISGTSFQSEYTTESRVSFQCIQI